MRFALARLGERIAQENLQIVGVPTSNATAIISREQRIPLTTFKQHQALNIAIDGADQVNPGLALIKGGGGAHVREKIVASAARRLLIIVDQTKLMKKLNLPVPVEILPFAIELSMARLKEMGGAPVLRQSQDGPVKSDNQNLLVDVGFDVIDDPATLESAINSIPGVVDNGLFNLPTVTLIAATESGLKILGEKLP